MARLERVKRVIDGDTFVTDSGKRVRLADASAPELKARGGQAAKRSLQSMVAGKTVHINTVARDQYGRDIARVTVGSKSVNNAVQKNVKNPKGRR